MHSVFRGAGNANLRGKLVKSLGCGCCDAEDLRGKYWSDQAKREMREAFERLESNEGFTLEAAKLAFSKIETR